MDPNWNGVEIRKLKERMLLAEKRIEELEAKLGESAKPEKADPEKLREQIKEILLKGPLHQSDMFKLHPDLRTLKHVLVDMEYDGTIWLNWSREYELR